MESSEIGNLEKVPDTKGPRKISAKDIVLDLKAGMTDAELMDKYEISVEGLHDIFSQLVKAKLATNAYFSKRSMKQAEKRAMDDETDTCPYCGYTSQVKFRTCPRCNREPSEWLDTLELTKILSFD
jgi:lipopolysaccharide biosynthesis regulator YciM